MLKTKFLVVGEMGYLGKLTSERLSVSMDLCPLLKGKITPTTNLSVLNGDLIEGSCILNFAATGVGKIENSTEELYFSNSALLEKLLSAFNAGKGSGFIHFASNYEIFSPGELIESRLPYVNSKKMGSAICSKWIEIDKRIKLLYLPTIFSPQQPQGRFFRDFIDSSLSQKPIKLSTPFSTIHTSTFDYFFESLCDFIDSSKNISHVEAQITCTVLDFALLLNEVIEELGFEKVVIEYSKISKFRTPKKIQPEPDEITMITLRKYITEMLGGISE